MKHIVTLTFIYDDPETFPDVFDEKGALQQAVKDAEAAINQLDFDYKAEGTLKVKDFIPKITAEESDFHNLSKDLIDDFFKLFQYLNTHEDKPVSDLVPQNVRRIFKEQDTGYLKKYKAMEFISQNINH